MRSTTQCPSASARAAVVVALGLLVGCRPQVSHEPTQRLPGVGPQIGSVPIEQECPDTVELSTAERQVPYSLTMPKDAGELTWLAWCPAPYLAMRFDSGVSVYIDSVGENYGAVLLNVHEANPDKTQLDWIDGSPSVSSTAIDLKAGIPGSVYVAAGNDLRLFVLGNGEVDPRTLLRIAREMMPLSDTAPAKA